MDELTLITNLHQYEYVCLDYIGGKDVENIEEGRTYKYWAHSRCYLRKVEDKHHPIATTSVLVRYRFTFHIVVPQPWEHEHCFTCNDPL